MTEEPESLILELLRQVRAELGDVRSEMATKSDLASLGADVAADMHTLRADVASDLLSTRKELGEQIVGLCHAVIEYHTSVIGHGTRGAHAPGRAASQPSLAPPGLSHAECHVAALLAALWACARRFSTILTAITEPS